MEKRLNREQRMAAYEVAITAEDLADAGHALAMEDLDPALIPDKLAELRSAMRDLQRAYRALERLLP
jgi:hypothetical protein